MHTFSDFIRARFAGSLLVAPLAALAACGAGHIEAAPAESPAASTPAGDLRAPESFASIPDRTARSRALFVEASRVLLSPRCANCHPSDDSPRQHDTRDLHDPPVTRGPDDFGVPAMQCSSCHQDRNLELARIPGAPGWRLAPKSMAWMGKSLAAICQQVKDPARNGGRALDKMVEHAAHDPIVAWGWSPGHGRTPAPGDQARFGALVAAWVDTGAACPTDDGHADEAPR